MTQKANASGLVTVGGRLQYGLRWKRRWLARRRLWAIWDSGAWSLLAGFAAAALVEQVSCNLDSCWCLSTDYNGTEFVIPSISWPGGRGMGMGWASPWVEFKILWSRYFSIKGQIDGQNQPRGLGRVVSVGGSIFTICKINNFWMATPLILYKLYFEAILPLVVIKVKLSLILYNVSISNCLRMPFIQNTYLGYYVKVSLVQLFKKPTEMAVAAQISQWLHLAFIIHFLVHSF